MSEVEAMTSMRMLVAAGFLAIPIGDPHNLHMLLFIRDRVDIRDIQPQRSPAVTETELLADSWN
jgi:hypothetical protein